MTIEIRQSIYETKCDKCEGRINEADLYLYTHGIGPCFYYCWACASGRYGYTNEDFEGFRPKASMLTLDLSNYDRWVNLGFSLQRIG